MQLRMIVYTVWLHFSLWSSLCVGCHVKMFMEVLSIYSTTPYTVHPRGFPKSCAWSRNTTLTMSSTDGLSILLTRVIVVVESLCQCSAQAIVVKFKLIPFVFVGPEERLSDHSGAWSYPEKL